MFLLTGYSYNAKIELRSASKSLDFISFSRRLNFQFFRFVRYGNYAQPALKPLLEVYVLLVHVY